MPNKPAACLKLFIEIFVHLNQQTCVFTCPSSIVRLAAVLLTDIYVLKEVFNVNTDMTGGLVDTAQGRRAGVASIGRCLAVLVPL